MTIVQQRRRSPAVDDQFGTHRPRRCRRQPVCVERCTWAEDLAGDRVPSPQPVSGRRTHPSVACGEPEHRVSTKTYGFESSGGCFLSGKPDELVAQRGLSRTVAGSAWICVESGRGAWGGGAPAAGARGIQGGWPAGRMNATAFLCCRATSRRTRLVLGFPVFRGDGW